MEVVMKKKERETKINSPGLHKNSPQKNENEGGKGKKYLP